MSLICCFGCLTCCGCRNIICQKLVYFPPRPQYTVARMEDPATSQEVTAMYHVNDKGEKSSPKPITTDFRIEFLKTSEDETIATLWIQKENARSTILFSHGNATDIGAMRDHLINVSAILQVNILAYDYSGYGMSSGKPTPTNTLADAECAYQHLRDKLIPAILERQKAANAAGANEKAAEPDAKAGDQPPPFNGKHRIICYGQSLGSGPTFHLSSKYAAEVSGVIVHSGIMSGLRVIRPLTTTHWFDIFPNVDKAKLVTAPVFIMHGTSDKEIPVHHGIGLAESAPNQYPPWWVEGAGHNNIEIHWRDEYYARVRTFVRAIEHDKVKEKIAEAKALAAAQPGAAPAVQPILATGPAKPKGNDSDDDDSTNGKSVPMEKVTVDMS